jgi:hypothetical protein
LRKLLHPLRQGLKDRMSLIDRVPGNQYGLVGGVKKLTDHDACIAIGDTSSLRTCPNEIEQVPSEAVFSSVRDDQLREIGELNSGVAFVNPLLKFTRD